MLAIVVFSALCLWSNAQGQNCCPGKKNVIENGTCPDGSKIILNFTDCAEKIRYEEDEFALSPDGFFIVLGSDEKVPLNRFCVVTEESTGESIGVVCESALAVDNNFGTICALVSVFFIFITIIVYLLVPKLRDLQGKCILILLIALMLSFISLNILQLDVHQHHGPCIFWGFTLYFTFEVTFFWLNVVAINMWRNIVAPSLFNKSDQFWFVVYLTYGFGAAIILLVGVIIAHNVEGDHIKPNIGHKSCFLDGPTVLWTYFYGPIDALLVTNLILFIWANIVLWKNTIQQSPRFKNLKYKCLLTLKLYLIMGIPWLFESMSYEFHNVHEYLDHFWKIMDVINSLQGILIFMVLVLFRKKALKGLASNRAIGRRLPNLWQKLDNAECSDEEELAEGR